MNKETPFISTTPLDILAVTFTALTVLTVSIYLFIAATIISIYCPFKLDFRVKGYAILITKRSFPKTGYGIMFRHGIKIWKYQKNNNGITSEVQIFPS
ncbi:MAG: hypothetical protein KKH34_02285 [Candidatus Omnitrophica bacterium]|nr:hypothetical protein [Candidatus Omnitrophota bacterium]MCG2704200.1 hypothetical protein [Candidatus Omnitrophota bacterium]